ncbi:MAG TPA: prepilin-type N-terminal cleavage/methylation domain-containing protein [Gemmatimonadaceae bacterium]|nr:prepilin-type N-terminal cleavage/methylation domain-containing protein [Gemmatimonadaceae bacterium]
MTVRFRRNAVRRAFTLAEILVALALMALLAAVLLPTVAGQITKGDAGRIVQDLEAVRSGAEQFLTDIRRYPGRYTDLSTAITTARTDILGNAYNAGMVSKWKGPYVTKDTLNASVETGFSGRITNNFARFTNTNAVQYLTIVVTGVAGTDFDKVDEQVDGPSVSPAGRTTGLLRWNSTGGIDSLKFFAMPIQ